MSKESGRKSLYVATHDYTSLTKVGVSINPAVRMGSITSHVGAEMTLVYESPLLDNALEMEKLVFNHFAEKRIKGEWFNESFETVVSYIKTIEHKFNNPEYKCLYCDVEFTERPEITREVLVNGVDTPNLFKTSDKFGIYFCNNYMSNLFLYQGGIVNHLVIRDYKTACSIATKHKFRIVELDLETGKFIKNPKIWRKYD